MPRTYLPTSRGISNNSPGFYFYIKLFYQTHHLWLTLKWLLEEPLIAIVPSKEQMCILQTESITSPPYVTKYVFTLNPLITRRAIGEPLGNIIAKSLKCAQKTTHLSTI